MWMDSIGFVDLIPMSIPTSRGTKSIGMERNTSIHDVFVLQSIATTWMNR